MGPREMARRGMHKMRGEHSQHEEAQVMRIGPTEPRVAEQKSQREAEGEGGEDNRPRIDATPQPNERGEQEINLPLGGDRPENIVDPTSPEDVLQQEDVADDVLEREIDRDIPERLGRLADQQPNEQQRKSQRAKIRREDSPGALLEKSRRASAERAVAAYHRKHQTVPGDDDEDAHRQMAERQKIGQAPHQALGKLAIELGPDLGVGVIEQHNER